MREAVALACRVRLRPVLMTSLATIIGLLPMALKLGAGSEAYAPLARAILGGLSVSVVLTVFLVPAAYVLVWDRPPGLSTARRAEPHAEGGPHEALSSRAHTPASRKPDGPATDASDASRRPAHRGAE